jgi:hypothetical protein
MTPLKRARALRAMYLGVALTVAATVAPYTTGDLLAAHIRAGYPSYSQSRIHSAVTLWLVILSVVGALGLASWLWTIRAVRRGKPWAPWAATAMFVLGTSVALTALLVKDTSGDTGLAPLLGWIGIAPCLAGLAAVTTLWRGSLSTRS